MIRIDIIGPSGIGKTTLLYNLTRIKGGRKWLTSYEAILKVIKKAKFLKLKRLF
jgi:ABC-type cobalamin/Fe3+-siderophores transport system ATPase subunit